MILTTHAIVGAAVAQIFPVAPGLAFGAAVASHYLVDLIPHREYSVNFFEKEKLGGNEISTVNFKKWRWSDTAKVALDIAAGVSVAIWLFGDIGWPALLAGILGGILPDTIRFWKPFKKAEVLHAKVHYHKKWHIQPLVMRIPEVLVVASIIIWFWR